MPSVRCMGHGMACAAADPGCAERVRDGCGMCVCKSHSVLASRPTYMYNLVMCGGDGCVVCLRGRLRPVAVAMLHAVALRARGPGSGRSGIVPACWANPTRMWAVPQGWSIPTQWIELTIKSTRTAADQSSGGLDPPPVG
jgi:hypothetical protein